MPPLPLHRVFSTADRTNEPFPRPIFHQVPRISLNLSLSIFHSFRSISQYLGIDRVTVQIRSFEKREERKGMKGGFYFLNLNIKYSFRVDRGWTLDVGIILAVLSAPPFFASAAQSYSGRRRRRRGRGRYTRASQRPRSSHARSALINHDGPARKKGGKKKFVAIIWRRARSKLGLFSLFTE